MLIRTIRFRSPPEGGTPSGVVGCRPAREGVGGRTRPGSVARWADRSEKGQPLKNKRRPKVRQRQIHSDTRLGNADQLIARGPRSEVMAHNTIRTSSLKKKGSRMRGGYFSSGSTRSGARGATSSTGLSSGVRASGWDFEIGTNRTGRGDTRASRGTDVKRAGQQETLRAGNSAAPALGTYEKRKGWKTPQKGDEGGGTLMTRVDCD